MQKRISVTFRGPDVAMLERTAKKRGDSTATIIREAVRLYFNGSLIPRVHGKLISK